MFAYTTPEENANWEKDGFKRVRVGHSEDEYIKLKEGQEVLIMIGAGLKQEKIEECLERHCTEGFEK